MDEMKFKIGDRVFKTSGISLFFNKYHYKNYIKMAFDTVEVANKNYFSTSNISLSDIPGYTKV